MLHQWSFAKVALVAFGWVAACVIVPIAWLVMSNLMAVRRAGSAGIGFVSVGGNVLLALLVLFGPPVLLVATWSVSRLRSHP